MSDNYELEITKEIPKSGPFVAVINANNKTELAMYGLRNHILTRTFPGDRKYFAVEDPQEYFIDYDVIAYITAKEVEKISLSSVRETIVKLWQNEVVAGTTTLSLKEYANYVVSRY